MTSVLYAGFGCAAACTAHYATAPGASPRNVVSATPSLLFSPAEITVVAGDSVTWVFGGIPHTVVFHRDDGTGGAPADIAATTNASIPRVFPTSGSFKFWCTLHPGMTGRVHVR